MSSIDAARNRIIQKYHVSPDSQLTCGMKADVYIYGPDTVLKLYPGTVSLAEMRTLQDFYHSLDRQLVPYAMPCIHTVAQEAHFLVTVEQRLPGTPMSALLPKFSRNQLEMMMQRYLTAVLALSAIQAPPVFDRYKLFDPDNISQRADGDWHRFIARYIARKLAQVGHCLRHDVSQFAVKMQQLDAILDQPYHGDIQLIHGDFFPGNLLVDENCRITALLDFGLLTMYGDHLFDIATSWVFFDMYDELKAKASDRYLAILVNRL